MLLFFVRHGDPTYHPDGLTPTGERQAEAIGRRLARFGLDRIYSSTAVRAQLTAKPAAELTRKEIVSLEWAHENLAWKEMVLEFPDGKNWCFWDPELRRKFSSPEVLSLGDKWYEAPCLPPNHFGEGLERVGRETDAFLLSLGYRHDRENRCYIAERPTDERVALFAHLGFGMSFLSTLLDIPYPLLAPRIEHGYTGMDVIEFRNNDGVAIPRLLELSCDAHLYAADLPTDYNRGIRF